MSSAKRDKPQPNQTAPKSSPHVSHTKYVMTLGQKLDAIAAFESKASTIKELQAKYKCGKSQIYNLIKQKDEMKIKFMQSGVSENSKRIRKKTGNERLNQLVLQWIVDEQAKDVHLTGPSIQSNAKRIALQLGLTEFKASNGWLGSFCKRHDVSINRPKIHSLHVVPDEFVVEEEEPVPNKLAELLFDYKLQDIAKIDVASLAFQDHDQSHASKQKCGMSRGRLAVLMCVFADGHVRKPFVVGRSDYPRCFQNINQNELPVVWRTNRRARVVPFLMEEYLHGLNEEMLQQERNIIVFMDEASSYTSPGLSNVLLAKLPETTGCVRYKMDIIDHIKIEYQKQMLRTSTIQQCAMLGASPKITEMDAIFWIDNVIEHMPTNFVRNHFRTIGLIDRAKAITMQGGSNPDDQLKYDETISRVVEPQYTISTTIEQIICRTVEQDHINEVRTDCLDVNEDNDNNADCADADYGDSDDDMEDDENESKSVSFADVAKSVFTLKSYAVRSNNAKIISQFYKLADLVQRDIAKNTPMCD